MSLLLLFRSIFYIYIYSYIYTFISILTVYENFNNKNIMNWYDMIDIMN